MKFYNILPVFLPPENQQQHIKIPVTRQITGDYNKVYKREKDPKSFSNNLFIVVRLHIAKKMHWHYLHFGRSSNDKSN